MMQIVLLNIPWNKNKRSGVRAGSRWPFTSPAGNDGRIHYIPFPFFLAYATSLLKKEGKTARLIDAVAERLGEQELIDRVKDLNPRAIVIETSTPSFDNDIKITANIHFRLPKSKIVLCGSHATVFAGQLLEKYEFIDYILLGEYEYTLLDLVNNLEKTGDLNMIPGLAYRKDRSRIRVNPPRPTNKNLDSLPWPERHDVPIYNYNDAFAGLPVPNVQMLASRGCPFECSFCLWPQAIYRERKYRMRNPADVVEEMEKIVKEFNFKAVYFEDDTFNIDRTHVLAICENIKRKKIKIPWAAMARADLMDEALLENLSDAGLYAVKYGIESADNKILKFCKKNLNLIKVNEVIKITKKLGIKIHLTFCLGLPGETRETIKKTLDFIQDVKPDSLQFSFATPFPGTEYYKNAEESGYLLSKNWSDYDGNEKCIVRTEKLSASDLEEIRAGLNNDLNFR
jgi:anaerobic magnesium-protoporphyrin IX monomethyl ester cyclase